MVAFEAKAAECVNPAGNGGRRRADVGYCVGERCDVEPKMGRMSEGEVVTWESGQLWRLKSGRCYSDCGATAVAAAEVMRVALVVNCGRRRARLVICLKA